MKNVNPSKPKRHGSVATRALDNYIRTTTDIGINFAGGVPAGCTTGASRLTVTGRTALSGPHLVAIQQQANIVTLRIDSGVVVSVAGFSAVNGTMFELGVHNGVGTVEVAELIVLHGTFSNAAINA